MFINFLYTKTYEILEKNSEFKVVIVLTNARL